MELTNCPSKIKKEVESGMQVINIANFSAEELSIGDLTSILRGSSLLLLAA